MHRFTTFRLCLAIALVLVLWTGAVARGKIAIDGLHGMPIIDMEFEGPYIDLPVLYPDMSFVFFDAARMPIYQMLAEGHTQGDFQRDSIEVEVPAGTHALYVALDVEYDPHEIDQLPYLFVISPDQTMTTGAYGMCHIDDPQPGRHVVIVDWCWQGVPYRIGTGPYIWEVYPPEDYDAVFVLRSLDVHLFRGFPTSYSSYDFSRLQQMLDTGGGVGLVYEGAGPIALKPIVRIRGMASQDASIQIDIPGRLTYALPQPQSTRPLIWHIPSTDAEAEYDYEAKFSRPLNFISQGMRAGTLVNLSWATVRDLKLIEFVRGQGYRIAEIGTLAPGEHAFATQGALFPCLDASRTLDESLRREALAAGMTGDEVESFFTKYSWACRVLADVCASNAPVCLYHIEGEDYDALLPMRANPAPAEVRRVLWVYSILSSAAGSAQAVHPRATAARELPRGERTAGILHEYGFMRETFGGDALDDMDAWGWHLYDLELTDPTDFVDWPNNIIFHTWGASPLAARLSEGVNQVLGLSVCGIIPEAGAVEVVLSGDDDTTCDYPGSPFPPGSYPPVVVARQEAAGGRLVGLADLHFLADLQDNLQLMHNIFDWLDEGPTGEGPDMDLPDAVAETTLSQGSSGETLFRAYNLGDEPLALSTELPTLDWITVTGPSEIVIAPGEMVDYTLAWSSEELLPGYYETQWTFTSNDPNEPSLTWPVRLRVVSGAGVGAGVEGAVASGFELLAPYPNPFNARVSIPFALPREGRVLFDLYNVLGQHVERIPARLWTAGIHRIELDFTGKPAGLYFLRSEHAGTVRIRKLMLLN